MYRIPLSSTSCCSASSRLFSASGAFGSNRPSPFAFFHARTLSGRDSYSSKGMTYLGTAETSVKFARAPGGRVSVTCADVRV